MPSRGTVSLSPARGHSVLSKPARHGRHAIFIYHISFEPGALFNETDAVFSHSESSGCEPVRFASVRAHDRQAHNIVVSPSRVRIINVVAANIGSGGCDAQILL